MQHERHWLIGAPVSYYTAKVRAYLRYKQIPFFEIPAAREVYRDVIIPRTGVRFIPVLITDQDVAVQDSAAILDHLEERYPAPRIAPQDAVGQLLAALLETYADEWLVLPAMHYRWNVPENRAFAIEEFGRLSQPDATLAEQRALGERSKISCADRDHAVVEIVATVVKETGRSGAAAALPQTRIRSGPLLKHEREILRAHRRVEVVDHVLAADDRSRDVRGEQRFTRRIDRRRVDALVGELRRRAEGRRDRRHWRLRWAACRSKPPVGPACRSDRCRG